MDVTFTKSVNNFLTYGSNLIDLVTILIVDAIAPNYF